MEFVNLIELEAMAKAKLPTMVYDYYAGSAESGQSARDNLSAFTQYRLVPRVLVDVNKADTSLQLFGWRSSFPVIIAPMAMHGMAHPDKELATARAAAAQGVSMAVSTMATSSISEVAAGSRHPCLLFQLYVIKDRAVVREWVAQAEAAGYKAVVVTVDAPRLGRREADERNRFHLPDGLELKNLAVLANKRTGGGSSSGGNSSSGSNGGNGGTRSSGAGLLQARSGGGAALAAPHNAAVYSSGLFTLFAQEVDDSLTWDFLAWLKGVTRLPVYIKGVLSPEDALLAVQHGADGLVVSNHGGRQLDHAPSALDMLPAVAAAVRGRVPLIVDGGVRRGADVLKALALGAQAVMLGRPVLYGLALGGQPGVERVLQLLRSEFELAMALSGCARLSDVSARMLLPAVGTAAAAMRLVGAAGAGVCCGGPCCGAHGGVLGGGALAPAGGCCGSRGGGSGASRCCGSAACCHAAPHSKL